jgi:hypothetical protein
VFKDSEKRFLMVDGNLVPGEDADWFTFEAKDVFEEGCNTFNIEIKLDGGLDSFVLDVFRGGCDVVEQLDCEGTTHYNWRVDFSDLNKGECPCSPEEGPLGVGGKASPGNNFCKDHTVRYYVRVKRKQGVSVNCSTYVVKISNGVAPLN